MSEMKIRLFGAFRNLQTDSELKVSPNGWPISVADLKSEIEKQWQGQSLGFDAIGLLKKSVLATEKKVLLEGDLIHVGDRIALLPPVSGG